jgi:hypothetical protein
MWVKLGTDGVNANWPPDPNKRYAWYGRLVLAGMSATSYIIDIATPDEMATSEFIPEYWAELPVVEKVI